MRHCWRSLTETSCKAFMSQRCGHLSISDQIQQSQFSLSEGLGLGIFFFVHECQRMQFWVEFWLCSFPVSSYAAGYAPGLNGRKPSFILLSTNKSNGYWQAVDIIIWLMEKQWGLHGAIPNAWSQDGEHCVITKCRETCVWGLFRSSAQLELAPALLWWWQDTNVCTALFPV